MKFSQPPNQLRQCTYAWLPASTASRAHRQSVTVSVSGAGASLASATDPRGLTDSEEGAFR